MVCILQHLLLRLEEIKIFILSYKLKAYPFLQFGVSAFSTPITKLSLSGPCVLYTNFCPPALGISNLEKNISFVFKLLQYLKGNKMMLNVSTLWKSKGYFLNVTEWGHKIKWYFILKVYVAKISICIKSKYHHDSLIKHSFSKIIERSTIAFGT